MVAHIRAHPAQFAEKTLLNAAEFYFPVVHDALGVNDLDGPAWVLYRLVVSAWHGALWVLALVGLWRQRRPTTRGRWLLALACVVLPPEPHPLERRAALEISAQVGYVALGEPKASLPLVSSEGAEGGTAPSLKEEACAPIPWIKRWNGAGKR